MAAPTLLTLKLAHANRLLTDYELVKNFNKMLGPLCQDSRRLSDKIVKYIDICGSWSYDRTKIEIKKRPEMGR